MKTSQSLSEPAAAAKPASHCAFPGCTVTPTKTGFRCKETRYCSKEHQGNEEAYLRRKEVFDVLEFGNASEVGPDLPLEQHMITRSEDLVKLRTLAKLCSLEGRRAIMLGILMMRGDTISERRKGTRSS
ncbi:hypothetical protein TrLO_g12655 [Triparma laevis f. longispina]|uniref:Uncharacterized protein n=1 Tax=Triparma laevis f. longispina TaxID=1714387 RepID=A0A9W7F9Z7_9STRA|nr:hypothetical protein TrLO_g12655 [Triparma laevis f. longispina]